MIRTSGLSYIRSTEENIRPQVLGLFVGGKPYRFVLETCHLDETVIGPVRGVREHTHDVYHILLYQEGDNAFLLNGRRIHARPGTLVITGPGEPHSFAALLPGPRRYHELTFSLQNEEGETLTEGFPKLMSLYTGMEIEPDHGNVHTFSSRQQHWCNLFYERLLERVNEPAGGQWFFIHRIIFDLFTFLVEELFLPAQGPGTAATDSLDRARAAIDQGYMKNDSVTILARAAGFSKEHFIRKFKARFGRPPIAYRQSIRIAAARKLLTNSNLLCKEVAARVGYPDLYTFSKAFKRETGHSPTDTW